MSKPNSVPNRVIKQDRVLLRGLSFLLDYAPRNPRYSIEALRALEEEVVAAMEAVALALITLRAASTATTRSPWRA